MIDMSPDDPYIQRGQAAADDRPPRTRKGSGLRPWLAPGATAVAVIAAIGAVAVASRPAQEPGATRVIYVATTGSDTNPGTKDRPWKTFTYAARNAMAGDTIIFADGTYHESVATRFYHGGTADLPIILKAANKHKAIIHYVGNENVNRLRVTQPHVTIQGFDIYADAWSAEANTADILVAFAEGSEYGRLIGNRIHRVYEDLIKVQHVANITIQGNTLFDTAHDALDMVDVASVLVDGNSVSTYGRVALLAKGGSRNVRFDSNTVGNSRVDGSTAAIAYSLGGATKADSAYKEPGATLPKYEGYNILAINNVAYSTNGMTGTGISFQGCKDCAAYNNVVAGAKAPVRVRDGGDPTGSGGAAWLAASKDPKFVNNIATQCAGQPMLDGGKIEGAWTHDYNLYAECPGVVNQVHDPADPRFVRLGSDWHLSAGSPGLNSGLALTTFGVYKDSTTPAATSYDLRYDRAGALRSGVWDLGVYHMP